MPVTVIRTISQTSIQAIAVTIIHTKSQASTHAMIVTVIHAVAGTSAQAVFGGDLSNIWDTHIYSAMTVVFVTYETVAQTMFLPVIDEV